jgi:hypothetical protein
MGHDSGSVLTPRWLAGESAVPLATEVKTHRLTHETSAWAEESSSRRDERIGGYSRPCGARNRRLTGRLGLLRPGHCAKAG